MSKTLAESDLERPLPALRAQFDALPDAPLMVIRADAQTVKAMKAWRPAMTATEIKSEGHAPRLEGALIASIAAFVEQCDGAR